MWKTLGCSFSCNSEPAALLISAERLLQSCSVSVVVGDWNGHVLCWRAVNKNFRIVLARPGDSTVLSDPKPEERPGSLSLSHKLENAKGMLEKKNQSRGFGKDIVTQIIECLLRFAALCCFRFLYFLIYHFCSLVLPKMSLFPMMWYLIQKCQHS